MKKKSLCLKRVKFLGLNKHYRQLNIDDLHQLICIEQNHQNNPYSESTLSRLFFEHPTCQFGCFLNQQLSGYLLTQNVLDEIEILRLFVHGNFRRKHIGSELFMELIQSIDLQRINKIFLEVSVDNIPAINLYKKLGFKILSKRSNYYGTGLDAYNMICMNE